MLDIYSEIDINAPAERVWDILMDFDRYSAWNPFIIDITGTPERGKTLRVTMQLTENRTYVFKPKVTAYERYRTFRWLGHFILPGIFDGEHIFTLEKRTENKTTFIQREKFRGLLSPMFYRRIKDDTESSFNRMNRALKTLCETRKPQKVSG